MLHRAALRLGAQVGLVVAVVVVVLTGLATVVVLSGQHNAQTTLLIDAVARADDVADPPAGVWLAIKTPAGLQTTEGTPQGLPDTATMDRVSKSGDAESRELSRRGVDYFVYTAQRDSAVVQAILDPRPDQAVRARLIQALLISGAIGLALAVLAGVWFGRRATRPLADALAMQRGFVADASHELRTPLTLLSMRAQLVRRKLQRGADPNAVRSEVDGIVGDAEQLSDTLDDLLIAVDPRAQAPTESVDLLRLAEDVANSARPAAEQRTVLITVDATENATVTGSSAALHRALTALVDNAVRHARAAVTITVRPRAGAVDVDVTDDGPGLDPAVASRSFERSLTTARADDPTVSASTPRRYGLGLALVSEIAARHRGTVEAASGPAGGARVRLTLPHR